LAGWLLAGCLPACLADLLAGWLACCLPGDLVITKKLEKVRNNQLFLTVSNFF